MMADNVGEITIERSLEQIKQGISDIGTASKAIDKDLRDVQKSLRFDPANTELLAEKQSLLANKLDNSRQRSEELQAAITELNRIKAENGQLTDGQTKLLETYEQQLKSTEREITALTGATKQQSEELTIVEEKTKSFSQSMTEFQSKISVTKQVIKGLQVGYELLGGDENSGIGKTLTQGQKVTQMMAGIASMNKLLGDSNSALTKTFGTLSLSVGAAIAGYSLGTTIIDSFGTKNRKVASIVAVTTGVVVALAVAGLAAAGALSWGIAVPAIVGAIGVGAAGLTALLKKETSTLSEAMEKNASITNAQLSSSSQFSTPSVPQSTSTVGTTSSQQQITIQSLSEQQIINAVHAAVTRVVIEQGINEPKIIERTTASRGEIIRELLSGGTAKAVNANGQFSSGGVVVGFDPKVL